MKVDVRLFASLMSYAPEGAEKGAAHVALPEDATVGDLLEMLEVPEGVVKLVFVNGLHAKESTALRHGDRVGIFPPVAGG